MLLRKLRKGDAPLMLEWMHDPDVTAGLGKDFAHMTLEDCLAFIGSAQDDAPDVHRAIVDENDEYLGTVSLKHLNKENGSAEFAIVVRKAAMGRGYARQGMGEIINLGFSQKGLKAVYWNVKADNVRAIRFYNKGGHRQVSCAQLIEDGIDPHEGGYSDEQIDGFAWYEARSEEDGSALWKI